jgi:TPR repeat protein
MTARLALLALLLAAALGPAFAGLAEGERALQRRDYRAALAEFVPLADAGDPAAQFHVGRIYFFGLGLARDEPKGAGYLERAAAQNEARAQSALGLLYLQGRGVAKDEVKGADLVRRAADAGIPEAQYTLGILVRDGRAGVPKDEAVALQWFRAAAERAYVPAYAALGDAYDRGLGVDKDEREAVAWWRKGAAANERVSQYQLAFAYLGGKGGLARDANEAATLLRRAANRRLPAAQAALGQLYSRGTGVPADYVLAHMWFNLARAQGFNPPWMREAMEALEQKMTPEQIADAQRRSREWRAGTEIADAIARSAPGAPKPAAPGARSSTGTGFAVSPGGHVVTNEHVVGACARVRLEPGGVEAVVLAKDARNDLALLKAATPLPHFAQLRAGRGVRPGDDVVVVGYPLRQVLASGATVTTGTVSALGGLANDPSKVQISAPIQPGNSGGPLLDRSGLVVGVIQSKLNALRIAVVTGDIPQNVNFAINAATLSSFLDAQGVDYRVAPPGANPLAASEVGEAASRYTVAVECLQ